MTEPGRRPFLYGLGQCLLRTFLPGEYRAVIAADLDEHWKRGTRSSAWYWRQVFSALHPAVLVRLARDADYTDPELSMNAAGVLHHIGQDVRHGLRLLVKTPALTAFSLLALALGIGLSTTMFSIMYGVLYRGLPFEKSEQIIHVERLNQATGHLTNLPIHDYHDWRTRQKSFVDLAAFRNATLTVSGSAQAERHSGVYLSANAFALLPVQPVLGRLFTPDDERVGAARVALISHTFWQTRYNGDPAVLRQTLRVNGYPTGIVGVLPAGFEFPNDQQIWLPLDADPGQAARGSTPPDRWLEVFGRLRDGVTLEQARSELNHIAGQLEREHPETNKDIRVSATLLTDRYIGSEPRGLLLTMMGAVLLVLLVACTNVASLLLGRAVLRTKEVGIRTALGATCGRLVTQFLTESFVLAALGAALGLVIALYGVRAFTAALPAEYVPFWIEVAVDRTALLFVVGSTVLSALFAGTLPAFQAARARVGDVLKETSRGASSFRLGRITRALVVFEIGLSGGLLVAAGITIKSVAGLRNVDMGFDASGIFVANLELPVDRYPDAESRTVFYDELTRRIRALPGVSAATLTVGLPGLGGMNVPFALTGGTYEREQDYPRATSLPAALDYFRTLNVQPVAGRDFDGGDRQGSLPVAIVNERFARAHFPAFARSELVVGQRIRVDNGQPGERWLTIVGVVPDVAAGEFADGVANVPAFYLPLAQNSSRFVSIMARTPGDPLALTQPVRAAVATADPDLAISSPDSLAGAVARDTWFFGVFGALFVIFGAAALAMATIGLYAVTSFAVSQRTREVGIRMALGARASDVVRMIVRQGLVQVGLGTLIGLGLATVLAQLLSVIMFHVQPRDPIVYGSVAFVLGGTALLACLIPARRATRVHPTEALRYE